jgi:geranylgeranyl diphosphate synthase, type II
MRKKINRMLTIPEIGDYISSEIEKESERLAKSEPANLYLPIKYILSLKGKKLRPSLVLLGYNLFSDNLGNALPAAIAIEVFHNFTLLHDDIMDNAGMRRNQPTVHKKFGENAAILSGDVMSFISFQYLLKTKTNRLPELLSLFSDTAVEVCEGQQYDMDFETRLDVAEKEYLEMIRLKTAVLLACSLKSGALIADAGDKTLEKLYEFGINLGLSFQLQDDLLDSYGDEKIFGKKIGGDILENKKTFLLVKALELANPAQKKELLFWLGKNGGGNEKITAVKSIFNELKIDTLVSEKIGHYFNEAKRCLEEIPVGAMGKEQLRILAKNMADRDY